MPTRKRIQSAFSALVALHETPSPVYRTVYDTPPKDIIDQQLYGDKLFEDHNRTVHEPGVIRWPLSQLNQLILSAEIDKRELEWRKKYRGESTPEALQKTITLDALKMLRQKHTNNEPFNVLDDLITPAEQMFGIHAAKSQERQHLAAIDDITVLNHCYDAVEESLKEVMGLTGFVQSQANPRIRQQPETY